MRFNTLGSRETKRDVGEKELNFVVFDIKNIIPLSKQIHLIKFKH